MVKILARFFLPLFILGCTGGGITGKVMSNVEPVKPPFSSLDTERLKLYQNYSSSSKLGMVLKYRHDYDLSVLENRMTDAIRERNKIASEMFGVIDNSYLDFREKLRLGKAGKDIIADLIVLGLNTAGAVTGGESLKAVLAATSAGVVGASASVDKNYLMSNTVQAIIGQMDTSRAAAAKAIYIGLKENINTYPLESVKTDMFKYYEAGTLTNALVALSATVQEKKITETREMNSAKETFLKSGSTGL